MRRQLTSRAKQTNLPQSWYSTPDAFSVGLRPGSPSHLKIAASPAVGNLAIEKNCFKSGRLSTKMRYGTTE